VKQIGRELNVRYVLEGSVQRSGNRLRVNVQLIDTDNGAHLWAERFNKPVADLFDMHDEIVARLANQLGTQLIAVEARRAERAPHPDSMDLYFQGRDYLNRGISAEHIAQASGFLERALARDPGNLEALVWVAFIDFYRATNLLAHDRATLLATAETTLSKAWSVAPEHAFAHAILGAVQIHTNRVAEGIAECERALALDPNLANAHAGIGIGKVFIGRSEETETHINEALRISPRDTNADIWLAIAGIAQFSIGKDEEAVAWLRRAVETNRNYPAAHLYLAAALALLGRMNEAQAAVRAGLALNPAFTIRYWRSARPTDNPTYLTQRDRLFDGMRKAGVPEE
jgi:tetratricopeptide (TPR) repeat protein